MYIIQIMQLKVNIVTKEKGLRNPQALLFFAVCCYFSIQPMTSPFDTSEPCSFSTAQRWQS